jgi:hypothetical protein
MHDGLIRRWSSRTVAALLLVIATLTWHPDPAHAAFVQATSACWPGPSGNACARIYYDSATNTWRGYGAVQPNPGKRIKLWNIWFSGCSNPDCNGPNDVFLVKNGDQLSNTYQRVWIDAKGPPCYWNLAINYEVIGGGHYWRNAPTAGRC